MVTGAVISTDKSVGSGFDLESVAFLHVCWTVRVRSRGNVNLGMEGSSFCQWFRRMELSICASI